MSYKWPAKDPSESLDYSIDWSRILRSNETVVSCVWYINDETNTKQSFTPISTINGLTIYDTSNNGTVTTIGLRNGTLNYTYKLFCNLTTTTGAILERSITIAIREH